MPAILILGDIEFLDTEIPSRINFAGHQMLGVHTMIGGQRQVDAMGVNPDDQTWHGMFFGENAKFRAQFLEQMAQSGLAYGLTYEGFSYSVVIRYFKPLYEAPFKIPYTISVVVVENLTNPINVLPLASYDQEIQTALFEAYNIALLLKNDPIDGAIAAVNVATENVNFNDASLIELNNIGVVIQSARNVVGTQIQQLTKEIFG